jgi:putative membrane protein
MELEGTEGIFAILGFILISLSLIFLILAITFAKRRQYAKHRLFISVATSLNILFLVSYVIRWSIYGDTQFAGPENIKHYVYYPILIIHILTALVSIWVVGKQLVQAAKNVKFKDGLPTFPKEYRSTHRQKGRIVATIWGLSFLGGIITFLFLYVLY